MKRVAQWIAALRRQLLAFAREGMAASPPKTDGAGRGEMVFQPRRRR